MSNPAVSQLDQLKQRDHLKRLQPAPASHGMEPLEPRRLLAASVDADGVLTITGTSGNDAITFTRTGADEVTATVNGQTTVFQLDDFEDLVIEGLGGDDRITIGNDTGGDAPNRDAAMVNGGDGNDTIVGGDSWWFNYDAGDGDDHVTAGARESVGLLGAGNDTFVGGGAADQVNFFTAADDGDDSIAGNGGDDELSGGTGNDSIDGGSGDDAITGDAGNDTVIGGAGSDILDGGDGTDSVVGNAGDDCLFNGENAGGDDNTVFLDAGGIIRIAGTPRKDLIDALDDGGFIRVQFGIAVKRFAEGDVNGLHADLGRGDDFISLRQSNEFSPPATLLGGDGNDEISGGAGNDVISGGNGHDEISGESGNDTLDGGANEDTLHGGVGDDVQMRGEINALGSGSEVTVEDGTLTFTGAAAGEQVSLWSDSAGGLVVWVDGQSHVLHLTDVRQVVLNGNGGNDLLKLHPLLNIPSLLNGGDGDDRLIGGSKKDTLNGGAGNDHITGNGGDDWIDGGFGSDVLRGNGGRDTLDYASRVNRLIVGLDGFQDDGEAGENDFACDDIERLIGGGANDKLGGGSGALDQVIYGGPGNDTIYGGGGKDALFGEAGNDRLGGGDGDDYLEGGAGHDALYGDGGGDTLLGLGGNDQLFSFGDGRTDSVNGGAGSDSADFDDLIDVVVDSVTGVETFI